MCALVWFDPRWGTSHSGRGRTVSRQTAGNPATVSGDSLGA